jgi:hypothetical protein
MYVKLLLCAQSLPTTGTILNQMNIDYTLTPYLFKSDLFLSVIQK